MSGDDAGTGARDERVFFIHVMKTGGSNLVWHVKADLDPAQVFPGDQDLRFVDGRLDAEHHLSIAYLTGLPAKRRHEIRFYSGHYPYVASQLLGVEVRTMSILRDPVTRTISLLRAIGRPGIWGDRTKRFPKASWPLERLYEDPTIMEPLIRNHQTKVFAMAETDPLHSFRDVVEMDEARLELATRRVEALDVLGVNERYDTFLADVAARFGWAVPPTSRVNPAREDDDRVASPSLLRRIAEDNALDVALHEHATALVAARHH
jgi:hypothetical protein